MVISQWLDESTKSLKVAGIGTARLDSLVLLEDVLGRNRAWLLAHPETEIVSKQLVELEKLLARRSKHEPLAYIRGKTEFYGREFLITSAVLEPRPESETMIDLLKKLPDLPSKPRIADVGTGSGALGITAYLELREASVDLLEIDPVAAQTAQNNVDKFTLNINVIESDLLDASDAAYDVLLCNLPYVPNDYQINTAASHEPRLAIFGGLDGLDLYRKLFEQLDNRSFKPLYILSESLPPQHKELNKVAGASDYGLRLSEDFIQVFRSNEL